MCYSGWYLELLLALSRGHAPGPGNPSHWAKRRRHSSVRGTKKRGHQQHESINCYFKEVFFRGFGPCWHDSTSQLLHICQLPHGDQWGHLSPLTFTDGSISSHQKMFYCDGHDQKTPLGCSMTLMTDDLHLIKWFISSCTTDVLSLYKSSRRLRQKIPV